jgi:signal transduction histidine kinase
VCRGASYQLFTISFSPLTYESFNPWAIFLTCAGTSASAFYSLGVMSARRGWFMGILAGLVSAGFVLSNLLEAGGFLMRGIAFLSSFLLIFVVVGLMFMRRRQNNKSASIPLILLGYAVLLACALHDIGMVIGYVSPDHWSLNSLGFTAMLLAYTLSGSQYLVRSLNRAEQSNQELEGAIAAKSAQLETSFTLLRESERHTARTQEREHLLREMHDGLGAQLMTAMRGVERGTLAREQVLQALQDSLDDLRLLMDSTDMGRQLQGALATWRHRWNPRLDALGLQLAWHVDDDLDSALLSPDAVLQVMRILQEATVNVVKHAQAQQIQIHAGWVSADRAGLRLTVTDDGLGHPAKSADSPTGRGLQNMAARAKLIGGSLIVEATPSGGTVVQLTLPSTSGH